MPCRTRCITMLPTCNEEHFTHSVVSDSRYYFGYTVGAKCLRFTSWLHQYYISAHHKLERKGSKFNNNVKIRHVWVSNFRDRVEKRSSWPQFWRQFFIPQLWEFSDHCFRFAHWGHVERDWYCICPNGRLGFRSFTSYKSLGLCHEFEWYT